MSLLQLRGIGIRFGATQALDDASFDLLAGEVHALCGANGAGKSTLSRVISGQIQPDRGEMLLDGVQLHLPGAREALRHGICMVTQETTLAPDLSVLENIMLPRLGLPGMLDWAGMRREAEQLVGSLGGEIRLSLDVPAGTLSIGQRQMVEILKALAVDSRIIIFDEPTASLSPFESEILFEIMRGLTARKRALVFVSHRLEEIFGVCDRVTVLREGRTVASGLPAADLSGGELVRMMIGRDLTDVYAHADGGPPVVRGEPVLRVHHLESLPAVRDVSFDLHAGEIVGLAGLVGAGRSETLETIFGLRKRSGGNVELGGAPFGARRPAEAIRAGLALVPEDRRHQSIVPDFTVRENLLLAHLGQRRGPGLGYDARTGEAGRLLDQLGLPRARAADPDLLNFSGGMQQKIILARWLLLKPRVLMLDEPTRGVDIGTRSSIYALLRQIAAAGVAVVVVSSDFEEIIGLVDRVVVMSDGSSVAELPSRLLSIESLAMFAAPRSSAQRMRGALDALVSEHGGVASWIGVEGSRLFCFDRAGDDRDAEPGFTAGSIVDVADTRIAGALSIRGPDFVEEPNEPGPRTLLVPVLGRRGHELGLVALTLAGGRQRPDPAAIARTVMAWTATTRPAGDAA
ncbi:sugar ABC transporter ATP-binding protein [Lichenicola cladoniae]|uniref:Sugar ABC transporter ATP-binding protein n=1 Tax=Lichenicola cladoniae TaxID=1484109 RepID=A0A6M8HTN0_9PROT|nr:sugar ABC transporter ATP-binding protein [Lichenicola cladoniae]NPD67755.1 sugar ABC transporter ATP-binding protein [Acetobacteraceae bacterium]QKE91680.1 sugar ABC transporter ATP-binding protein [Lichenicola cladoniae]